MRVTDKGLFYTVSPQHLEVAATLMAGPPIAGAVTDWTGNEDNDVVYETAHQHVADMDEQTVIKLFFASDWDCFDEPDMDTYEGRMALMRRIVGTNITDSIYQIALGVAP